MTPPTLPRTQARLALSRTGATLSTQPLLDFRLAHAQARDAVHTPLDEAALRTALQPLFETILTVSSQASDRQTYLLRPDLGRRLSPAATPLLAPHAGSYDLAIALGDGLSAQALQRHAAPVLQALLPALQAESWSQAPLVLILGARVATADEVAQHLGARAVLILLGERPGLSAPDSLGAYLTWHPSPTTTDADRNCISNIRPAGLAATEAAHRLHHLLHGMRRLGRSGVALKDESGQPPSISPPPGALNDFVT